VISGSWLGWTGTAVLAAWTLVLVALAGWAYRKDTLRA
jgi:hypothetical protein